MPGTERCAEVIGENCSYSYADILSGIISPDHIYVLTSEPSHFSISKIVHFIKGINSNILQEDFILLGIVTTYNVFFYGVFRPLPLFINLKEVQEFIENIRPIRTGVMSSDFNF